MFDYSSGTITITQGDSKTGFGFKLWDDKQKTVPRDLTGKNARLVVAKEPGKEALISLTGVITGNQITFNFLPTHTKSLKGEYVFDVELYDGSNFVETLPLNGEEPGVFVVVPEVAK